MTTAADSRGFRSKLARQPDLYGSVRIGGPISGMEKRRFLLDAEGFVSSRWESHSVALLEVLSLGIPSIVSSVLHVAPVLQRYDAALLATPDATSLAAALQQFDEAREVGPRGRSMVGIEFTWERAVEQGTARTQRWG